MMKKRYCIFLAVISILTGCTIFFRTVNVVLDPASSGWYFIELVRDSTLKDNGTITLNFDDTTRFMKVFINDINKTIVSPFDKHGNSLSNRLQYPGIKPVNNNINFFVFYNPTDTELAIVKKWNPTDEYAWKIMLDEDKEFSKYYKSPPAKSSVIKQ